MQLILTYIVYREHKENKIIKLILITGVIYTLVSVVLALYDGYYAYRNTMFDDFSLLLVAQMRYQLILALILLIGLIANKVNLKIAMEAILLPLISIAMFLLNLFLLGIEFYIVIWLYIPLGANIFTPILIYILSYTANGKLFAIEDQKDYFSFIKFRS